MRQLTTLCILSLVGVTASAATITITPSWLTVQPGDSFTLSVNADNIDDLYAFQIGLVFDPNVLRATSSAQGPFLPPLSSIYFPGMIDNDAGTISFLSATLVGPIAGVTGSGTLATIDFAARGPGTSSVTFSDLVLLNQNFVDITTGFESASITVGSTSVPEPAAATLVAEAGLLVLAVAGIRGHLRCLKRRP